MKKDKKEIDLPMKFNVGTQKYEPYIEKLNENVSEEEMKKKLSKEQYKVLREKATEKPGSGKWLFNKEKGVYVCAACGQQLFKSDTKFESGSGWPSFYDVAKKGNVKLVEDEDGLRTEVVCSNCGSHLGHVFDDGPKDKTGKRYCINSLALDFEKDKK